MNQPTLERLCSSEEPWNNGRLPHILLFWTHALENNPPPPQSEWLAHLTAGIKDTLFSRRDSPGERKPPSTRAGARRTGRLCCLNKSVLMSHHIQEILMRDPDGSVYI